MEPDGQRPEPPSQAANDGIADVVGKWRKSRPDLTSREVWGIDLPADASSLAGARALIYVAVAAVVVILVGWSLIPPETSEVTGTIISVTESKGKDYDYDLLVEISGSVALATYSGAARLNQGQRVVLEEVVLSRWCRDPLRKHLSLHRQFIKNCRKRYTVKGAIR